MKKAFVILLIWPVVALSFEGPELMLASDNYILRRDFLNPAYPETPGARIEATAQHAFLYGIKSLAWTYVASRISVDGWSAAAAFRNYGIDDLYMSAKYSLFIGKSIIGSLSLGIGYSRSEITFGDNLVKSSSDKFSLAAGLGLPDLSLSARIDNLNFTNTNEIFDDKPEMTLVCNWQAEKSLSICALLYKDKRNHTRLILGQDLELHKTLNLIAGIMSGPELYFAGFEIVYKRLNFGYTFYDVGGLPDCSKLTITYR